MTFEEAKEYLTYLSYLFGTTGVESLNEKDGDKMRQAIEILADNKEENPCSNCQEFECDYCEHVAEIRIEEVLL